MALGKEASFLYSTVDTYVEDARKDNRSHLVEIWDEMKSDKQKTYANVMRGFRKGSKRRKVQIILEQPIDKTI